MPKTWLGSWLPQLLQPLSAASQKRSAAEAFGSDRENAKAQKAPGLITHQPSLTPPKVERPGLYRQGTVCRPAEARGALDESLRKQRRLCGPSVSQQTSHESVSAAGLPSLSKREASAKASLSVATASSTSLAPVPTRSANSALQRSAHLASRKPCVSLKSGSVSAFAQNAKENLHSFSSLSSTTMATTAASRQAARRAPLASTRVNLARVAVPPKTEETSGANSGATEEGRLFERLNSKPLPKDRSEHCAVAGSLDTPTALKTAAPARRTLANAATCFSATSLKEGFPTNSVSSSSASSKFDGARPGLVTSSFSSSVSSRRANGLGLWGSSSALPLMKNSQATQAPALGIQKSASASSLPLLSAMAAGRKAQSFDFMRSSEKMLAVSTRDGSVGRAEGSQREQRTLREVPGESERKASLAVVCITDANPPRLAFPLSTSKRPTESAAFKAAAVQRREETLGCTNRSVNNSLSERAFSTERRIDISTERRIDISTERERAHAQEDASGYLFVSPKLNDSVDAGGEGRAVVRSTEKAAVSLVYGHRVLKPLVSKRLEENFFAFPEIQNHWRKYCESQMLTLLISDKELTYYTRGAHHPVLAKRFQERQAASGSLTCIEKEAISSATVPRARPLWAESHRLEAALRVQRSVDPFSVFGEAPPELVLQEVYKLQHYNAVSRKTLQRHPVLATLSLQCLDSSGGSADTQSGSSERPDGSGGGASIGEEEWTLRVLPALERRWERELAVELNWKHDPLTAEEVVWYLQAMGACNDVSENVTLKQPCYCPTPPPNRNWVWTDSRHILSNQNSLSFPTPSSSPLDARNGRPHRSVHSPHQLPSPKTPGLRRKRRRKLRGSPVSSSSTTLSSEVKRRRFLANGKNTGAENKSLFVSSASARGTPDADSQMLQRLLSDAQRKFKALTEKAKVATPSDGADTTAGNAGRGRGGGLAGKTLKFNSATIFSPAVSAPSDQRRFIGALPDTTRTQLNANCMLLDAARKNACATANGCAAGTERRSPLQSTPPQSEFVPLRPNASSESTSNRWRTAVLRPPQTFC